MKRSNDQPEGQADPSLEDRHGGYAMTSTRPRALTEQEVELLRLLLTQGDFPGARELAVQVDETKVIGGLATLLDLDVPRAIPAAPMLDGPIPVRAFVQCQDEEAVGEVLVWVKDGYLSGLEFAWYTDTAPTEMPAPDRIRFD